MSPKSLTLLKPAKPAIRPRRIRVPDYEHSGDVDGFAEELASEGYEVIDQGVADDEDGEEYGYVVVLCGDAAARNLL